MKIILEPIRTIQVEYFSSENSTLLHFFFQCILSFAKHKCSTLCFVVNEGFFFNFSLLIFLQDSWTRRTLEILTLTLDFSIICFVNCLRWSWKRVELRVGSYTLNCSLIIDRITMTADQYFSFCHDFQHFLRTCVLLHNLLLLSMFLLLITVSVSVLEFAFFQTFNLFPRPILTNLYNIYTVIFSRW